MAKAKTAEDGKSQKQKFIEAAERLGLDESSETFRSIVRKIANAPAQKPKKGASKSKD